MNSLPGSSSNNYKDDPRILSEMQANQDSRNLVKLTEEFLYTNVDEDNFKLTNTSYSKDLGESSNVGN
jgi:hypothetical protein